jgi:UDP-glucose 4-epimerase
VNQVFEKVSGQNYLTRLSIEEKVMLFRLMPIRKANTILGWKTRSTIEEAIASAWKGSKD